MRDWISEPIDERPVIGHCEVCGCDIHGEGFGYYGDEYYDFFGTLCCEEHLREFCDRNFKKGE